MVTNRFTISELKTIFGQKKSRFDKKRNVYKSGFTITSFESFQIWANKTTQICHYCDLTTEESKLLFDAQRNQIRADGTRGGKRCKRLELDRKDPNDSYDNLDNLVWACYWCNNAKSNFFIYDEFIPIGKVIGTELKKIISNLKI